MSRINHANAIQGVVFRLSIVAAIVAATAGAVSAQSRNTITGFVFTPDRRPVPQIYVEVMNEVYQVLQRTRTDGSGRYFFGNLSSGRFVVKVLPLGTDFEEQSQEVEIVNIPRPGGSTSDQAFKDFYLRARRMGPNVKEVSGTIYVQDVPENAKKLYAKGIEDLQNNRADAGMQSLIEAVTVFPEYYLALERLGREYMARQNYEYARAVYTKIVSVNDKSFGGWYGLGFASYALKQSPLAVEAASKAIALDGSSTAAFILLGISHRQGKNFVEAEKALLSAKALAKGTSADVHWNLALLYGNNMNRYKEAADELELYLRLAPVGTKLDEVKKLVSRFREKAAAGNKLTQDFS